MNTADNKKVKMKIKHENKIKILGKMNLLQVHCW
jgi:hypothetical protein